MADFRIQPSERISRLPPYLFARINALKHKKRQQGIDIIDLGMGNPSDPTPKVIVDKLNHQITAIERVPETRARLDVIGFDPVSNTPDEFVAYVKTEVVKWAKVIKDSGAHVD